MRRVEHSGQAFALDVPDAWQVRELAGGLVAAPQDAPGEPTLGPGFAVTLEELPDGDHDAAYLSAQGLLQEARWLTDLELLDEEDVELPGGVAARRTLATYRLGVSSLTIEQWHAVHGGRALVLAAMGPTADYAAQHELWHAMADSVALRDDG